MPRDRAVTGVILAGGLSRRMGGGDKCLCLLGGRPILDHVIDRVRPQVGDLVLNANGDPARFAAFGLPVVSDPITGFVGPLAGILSGLDWAAEFAPASRFVASVAADAPFVPRDLVARMVAAAVDANADLACAASGGRTHPVIGLWKVSLREALRAAITDEKIHKVDSWTSRYRPVEVPFAIDPVDPFFNVNQASDLGTAEDLLMGRPEPAGSTLGTVRKGGRRDG